MKTIHTSAGTSNKHFNSLETQFRNKTPWRDVECTLQTVRLKTLGLATVYTKLNLGERNQSLYKSNKN